ncbi:hypothetical protein AB6D11_00370 [Vibrio splendidus]
MSEHVLLWLHCETGGLNTFEHGRFGAQTYPILSVSAILTLKDGEELARYTTPIHSEAELLETLSETAIGMHEHSGLLTEVNDAPITVNGAEQALMNLLQVTLGIFDEGVHVHLAGHTAFTRPFLDVHMPSLIKALHLWDFNINTIYCAMQLWDPEQNKERSEDKWIDEDDPYCKLRVMLPSFQYFRQFMDASA